MGPVGTSGPPTRLVPTGPNGPVAVGPGVDGAGHECPGRRVRGLGPVRHRAAQRHAPDPRPAAAHRRPPRRTPTRGGTMTEPEKDCYLTHCHRCDREIWAVLPEESPSHVTVDNCDDCWFEQFGDQLSINELRGLSELNPDNAQVRDRWLEEYRLAG